MAGALTGGRISGVANWWSRDGLVMFGLAGALGLLGGALSATGRPELLAIFAGLVAAMLVMSSRHAVLWFVLAGALVATGVFQLYLPGSRYFRYVVPLASLALLLHWLSDALAASRRRQPPTPIPAPVQWALAFAGIGGISVLVNLSDPGVAIMGLKDYFQMWMLFLGLVFLKWAPGLPKRLWRALVLVALVQIPFAAHQYLFLVPLRLGLGEGIVAVDVVAGTFGATLLGGGANAVLAAFMVIVVGCLLALWKNGVMPAWRTALLALLLLSPLMVNEAKISALYLPLVFVVVFYRDIVTRPGRFLLAGLAMAGVFALLMTALTLSHPTGRVSTWSDLVDFTVERQTAGIEERRGQYSELSRLTALTFWAREHVTANPANTLVGHGLGSSRVQDAGLDLAHTLAEKRYGGLQIGYTALSALLWDTGVIGLCAVLGMFWSAFSTAGWLASHYRGHDPFRTALFEGLQAGVAVLALSLAHKDFFVTHLPYQALTYLVIGFIGHSWLRVVRDRG